MCQQNLNVANFVERILKPGGASFINLIFVDPADYPSQELLYMKSILRTFIEHFHNMLVLDINKVLGIKDGDVEKTLIEHCDENSFINFHEYEFLIEENFWYNTDTDKENEISFDFKRIEYRLAKLMKKKYINFEEKDLKYYNFKDTKITENEQIMDDLVLKIEPTPIDDSIKRTFEELNEENTNKSYSFMLEMGEYIYQNFLFNDSGLLLKNIIQGISNSIVSKRFSSYEDKLHSKIKIGHINEYFTMLKEKRFDFSFNVNRSQYNKPLNDDEKHNFRGLIDDANCNGDQLEEIKIELKDNIRRNYHRGDQLLNLNIGFLTDISEIFPTAEFINDLKFNQYLEIAQILNDGVMIKSKLNFVTRTSSNYFGKAEKTSSSEFVRRYSKLMDEEMMEDQGGPQLQRK